MLGRIWGYPCCVRVFGFEDKQRRDRDSGCTYTLDSCYPLLPSMDKLPTRPFSDINQGSGCLACINRKFGLIKVVSPLGGVLVL